MHHRIVLPLLLLALTGFLKQKSAIGQTVHQGVVTRSFLQPINKSIVATAESGIVTHAIAREGDAVKQGQRLAELNHDVLLHAKRQADARAQSTAARDAAAARYKMLQSQKKALEELIADGHVNRYELQQKATEFENAQAEYRKAKEEVLLNQIEVNRIEAQIQQRIIKSPINGVVVEIHKQPGEHLSTTEPQYATVVQIDQLKARFYLDADRLNQIRVGNTVPIFVGRDRSRVEASVIYVSPIIDSDSGTGRIEVVINNEDNALQSGTFCVWGGAQASVAKENSGRAKSKR